MKVEQQQAKFSPVTITIENEQELKVFCEVFGAMTKEVKEHINYDTEDLFLKLDALAGRYGVKYSSDLTTTLFR